jgi:DNA-binding NarL/FixJ family response regulator
MRILLVENQPQVRFAVQTLLQQQEDIEIAGEAVDGLQAIQMAEKLNPDVVLMDIAIPGMDGFETARLLKARCLTRFIVVLTTQSDAATRARTAEAGVDAFVDKAEGSGILLASLREVYHKLINLTNSPEGALTTSQSN